MAFIITGTLQLIGTTIKYGLLTAVITAGIAVATKPSLDTFDPYFKSYIKGKLEETGEVNKKVGIFSSIVSEGISWGANKMAKKQTKDLILLRAVNVRYDIDNKNQDMVFIGLFNGWYCYQE